MAVIIKSSPISTMLCGHCYSHLVVSAKDKIMLTDKAYFEESKTAKFNPYIGKGVWESDVSLNSQIWLCISEWPQINTPKPHSWTPQIWCSEFPIFGEMLPTAYPTMLSENEYTFLMSPPFPLSRLIYSLPAFRTFLSCGPSSVCQELCDL